MYNAARGDTFGSRFACRVLGKPEAYTQMGFSVMKTLLQPMEIKALLKDERGRRENDVRLLNRYMDR